MRARLAVFWATILAAGAAVVGVLTGRRRRRRAERKAARAQRGGRRTTGRGGRKRGGARSGSAPAVTTRPAEGPARDVAAAGAAASGDTRGEDGDDLRAIKGLGSVTERALREAGVTRYEQIAAWTPDEARAISERLNIQPGRIEREDWIGQARALSDPGRAASPGPG